MALTPIAERLAVELSLPGLRRRSVAAWIRTPSLPLSGRTTLPTAPPQWYLVPFYITRDKVNMMFNLNVLVRDLPSLCMFSDIYINDLI